MRALLIHTVIAYVYLFVGSGFAHAVFQLLRMKSEHKLCLRIIDSSTNRRIRTHGAKM